MNNLFLFRHQLKFIKSAKTSRNTFESRTIYYLVFKSTEGIRAVGEFAPLQLLSIDDHPNYEEKLVELCLNLNELHEVDQGDNWPSLQFGKECFFLSKENGIDKLFDITSDNWSGIKINGLVWMNEIKTMEEEARAKISQGFRCLKFKVGAHDFDEECRLLERIRKDYSPFKLEIRLDANGSFEEGDALEKLRDLSRFDIHSIEQPIMAGNWDGMARISNESKIRIALDEELIGVDVYSRGKDLLQAIQPHFIILKPNLIGGFRRSDEWVRLAHHHDIDWWATSALESNIGLNAISQWCGAKKTVLPQGLGTGSLYSNNVNSPLTVKGESLWYEGVWEFDQFFNSLDPIWEGRL